MVLVVVVVVEVAVVVVVVLVVVLGVVPPPPPCSLGSKHSQTEQYCVLALSPQQSPPSHSHPALLFSSSQNLSPFQSGYTQPVLTEHTFGAAKLNIKI